MSKTQLINTWTDTMNRIWCILALKCDILWQEF